MIPLASVRRLKRRVPILACRLLAFLGHHAAGVTSDDARRLGPSLATERP